MSTATTDFDVAFLCSALAEDELFVRELRGREGLSQLFEFDVHVEATHNDPLTLAQFDAIVGGRAMIAFGTELTNRIHGVVRQIDALPAAEGAPPQYRLKMVPRLFDTTLTRGSWVYQDMSVPEIVFDVLGEAGLGHERDFVFRLTGRYEKLEYVVQYNESDFEFLSRICEHAGIFYYFEHSDSHATVVFADSNAALVPAEGLENIAFDPRVGVDGRTEVLTAIAPSQTAIPKGLIVRDFNYRTPAVPLMARQPVDEATGIGTQVHYGEHFKTPDDGKRLARIRSEEWLARRRLFRASGGVRAIRSGHAFTLVDHPVTELGIKYVVVEMQHHAQQSRTATAERAAGARRYHNDLVLIPHATPFRPARVTPKPRIHGVTHATIDAAGDDGVTAPIDEHGRYKVVLPWDVGARPGGKASRWIRMTQPSSGPGYGFHFPLHAGTEVLLIHIDGDPDRPVILASVPNAILQTPVTASNATQSMMRTRTGIMVTLDDAAQGVSDDD